MTNLRQKNGDHYKAKTACEVGEQAISDHFVDVNTMVELGSSPCS